VKGGAAFARTTVAAFVEKIRGEEMKVARALFSALPQTMTPL
jgi:hypothetical protein